MKKIKSLLAIILLMSVFTSANAAIYIKYYNTDSKSYKFKVKTCGSTKSVEFGSSKSSSVTIQSGCDDAIIYTDCGEITLKDDDKIKIKDGCIIIE